MKEFRKVHQFNAFSCDTPKQVALSEFIRVKENYLSLGKFLQDKRDFFKKLMQSTRLEPLPSYGSYFQVYSYKNISEEPEMDFAVRLTRERKVASIPVSAFYQDNVNNQVLRFCFAKKEATLSAAVERLAGL
jgi:methionine aminotransferase